jgi:hypothetical protein
MKRFIPLFLLCSLASCASGRVAVRYPDGSEDSKLHVCVKEAPGKLVCLDFKRFMEYAASHPDAEEQSGSPDLRPDAGQTYEL